MASRTIVPASPLRRRPAAQRSAHRAALVGILQLLCAPAVLAFDAEGHDAVGQTTASAMDQAAQKQLKRLLGGQDASDVAGWGHQVDDTYPDMAKLHFQTHEGTFCEDVEKAKVKCEDNICLLSAIKHFYGRILIDEGRKPESGVHIDLNKVASGLKFTDADAVKMLINLLGDLHQPMHLGYADDDMGRKIQVKFRGTEMSLYDFWDKHVGEVVRKDEASFWLGGWTHVGRVRAEFDADKEAWKKEGAFAMFDKWELETSKFACSTAYKLPNTGKMLSADKLVVEIDEAAYQEWRSAWLRQILLAGERTAIVLNDILDDKGAQKLSEGTKIKTKADEEAEVQKVIDEKERKEFQANSAAFQATSSGSSTPPNAMGNFLTNLLIACFVVPGFLFIAAYGMNPFDVRAALAWLEASSQNAHGDGGSADGAGPPIGAGGPKYSPGAGKRAN